MSPTELDELNRIVTAYLEFAELRALNRKPMYMADWITKLNEFLRMSERELLDHAGRISHQDALAKAEREYEEFRAAQVSLPSRVEQDFEAAIKALPAPKKLKKKS